MNNKQQSKTVFVQPTLGKDHNRKRIFINCQKCGKCIKKSELEIRAGNVYCEECKDGRDS